MQKIKDYALRLCITLGVLSAFGFVARWVQNMSIYDEETHLAIEGAASSQFLVIYSVVVIIGLIIMALPLRQLSAGKYPPADIRGDSQLYKGVCMLVGVMFMAAGIMLILQAKKLVYPELRQVLGMLALFSGLCVIYTGRTGKSGADSPMACFTTIVPVLFGCFWLVVSYKDHSANPVVWSYAVEILAVAASTMALYLIAGFVFGRARVFPTCAMSAVAAYFCFMALGDERGVAYQICFAALGIFFGVTLFALVSSLNPRRKRFSHMKEEI